MYPLRLAPGQDDGGWLPIGEADWRENLDPLIAQRLRDAYGQVSVEDVAWYVLGVLSSSEYRERYASELAIDHPRIPFPASREAFDVMREVGERLGAAHLLEAPMPADGARLEGSESGRVDEVRYEAETASVWINREQRFTGVRLETWAWGQGFRPPEHFLTDRKGRALDMGKIEMFCRAVLVEESLALAQPMNQAFRIGPGAATESRRRFRSSGAPPYWASGSVILWRYRRIVPGYVGPETLRPMTVVQDDAAGLVACWRLGRRCYALCCPTDASCDRCRRSRCFAPSVQCAATDGKAWAC